MKITVKRMALYRDADGGLHGTMDVESAGIDMQVKLPADLVEEISVLASERTIDAWIDRLKAHLMGR